MIFVLFTWVLPFIQIALILIVVAAQNFNLSNRALFGLFIRPSDAGGSDNVSV
jgi:hypothetical protein